MQIRKSKKANSKGFTLIELLIVIIIIGILAAVAFVAYSGSQNKAHKAAAQSALSEVQSKLAEYNSDNGNYPTDINAVTGWLTSSAGGNNTSLAGVFTTANGYVYAASPSGCDDSSGNPCTGYSATADATIWGDSNAADNITVTN